MKRAAGLLLLVLALPGARAQDDGLPPPRPGGQQPAQPDPAPTPAPAPTPTPTPAPDPEQPAQPAQPTAPERQGRVRFEREQGQGDALKAQLERLLTALRQNDAAALGEQLETLAPDEAALRDAFTDEGFTALGPKILERGAPAFAGEPADVARRLGLRPDLETIEVFVASTEDLLSMEAGSDAAREFASGLRRTADKLEPRYRWYCAVLSPKAGVEGPELRLQLFFFHQDRWVLLGRIWRIEEE